MRYRVVAPWLRRRLGRAVNERGEVEDAELRRRFWPRSSIVRLERLGAIEAVREATKPPAETRKSAKDHGLEAHATSAEPAKNAEDHGLEAHATSAGKKSAAKSAKSTKKGAKKDATKE